MTNDLKQNYIVWWEEKFQSSLNSKMLLCSQAEHQQLLKQSRLSFWFIIAFIQHCSFVYTDSEQAGIVL